jgi:hypothetical protein
MFRTKAVEKNEISLCVQCIFLLSHMYSTTVIARKINPNIMMDFSAHPSPKIRKYVFCF